MARALWRLYRAHHGPGIDGAGGTFAEGRWHSLGRRVAYFGASAAIVVLERLAHTDPDLLPSDLRLALFELPDRADSLITLNDLPGNWVRTERWTQITGDDWLRSKASCLLAVPSAILPEETNYAFNPDHPDARKLRLVRERPFSFDLRLI